MKQKVNQIFFGKKLSPTKNGAGFTLVEMVVVIFVFGMIAVGLIALMSNLFSINRQQGGLLSEADQARQEAFKITNEFRNAQVGMDGSYPLNTAQSQQLVFFSNADLDPSIERIRYYLQSGKLYRGVTEFNGTTYNTSTEVSAVVQNDVANASNTPLFYYYDGTYTGGAGQNSLAQPVSPTAVTFIKLNLQIYDKAGVKNTAIYTVTASGAIRNLKTNLAQ